METKTFKNGVEASRIFEMVCVQEGDAERISGWEFVKPVTLLVKDNRIVGAECEGKTFVREIRTNYDSVFALVDHAPEHDRSLVVAKATLVYWPTELWAGDIVWNDAIPTLPYRLHIWS